MSHLTEGHDVSANFVETDRWLDPAGWSRSERKTLAEACRFSAGLCTSLLERTNMALTLPFLNLDLYPVDRLGFALTTAGEIQIHEALVPQLRRHENSMHRHASRAIPSRSCRYRSGFTSSGCPHSPRYVPPTDSCVTEAA